MRRLAPIVLALAAVVTATTLQAAPAPLGAPVFVLTGGGYGHGVGMAQYGALGQAQAGRSYEEILAFYYPGTELAKAPVTRVRVLLAEGVKAVRVSSDIPFRVQGAKGTALVVDPGTITFGPALKPVIAGKRVPLAGPVTVSPGNGSQLRLGDVPYRGQLVIDKVPGALRVVNTLGLDAYLLGVVPGEVPKEWPEEALKAQAVAARSYAVASLLENKPYDLYADVRSQVYRGFAGEAPTTTRAVRQTGGRILVYDGEVATTFYYSSSGGRTASAVDVFGLELPYLQTTDDPWDEVSPHHVWPPKILTASVLKRAFGLTAPVTDIVLDPTPSGRPSVVRIITGKAELAMKPTDVRSRLGLRSTLMRIGVLRLRRVAPAAVAAGATVTLAGMARDVDEPVLQRLAGTTWTPAVKLKPAEDGTFAVNVRPTATTRYRLSAYGLPGPTTTVTVAESP